MKAKHFFLTLVAFSVIGVVGYIGYRVGLRQSMAPVAGKAATPSATGRTVLYWQDPMKPGQRFDKPGKSPYMDMPLVPVYADESSNDGKVTVSSRVRQNLGIRTAEVARGNLTSGLEVVGNIAYNERELVVLQARASSYVEKLYVSATFDPVRKGQALAELYVPDWIAAQEDFLTAKRLAVQEDGKAGRDWISAARQRMRLAGMSDNQIRLVETSGKVQARLVIAAPVNGVVAELGIREGMTVAAGAPLFRINGLDTVWVNAEVPEAAMAEVHPGNAVEVRTSALPGVVFRGKVNAVLPNVDPATRTMKTRVELVNPRRQFVPGMFATVNFSNYARRDVLLIPSEAVIKTGRRSVVIVAQGEGKFSPVDIETGRENNGQTEILKGLSAGQKVVVSGQFLIDSEASLTGTALRMGSNLHAQVAASTHRGTGRVEAIDKDEITISHGPISSLQWPAMTMSFRIPASGLPQGIKTGDRVDFEIKPVSEGEYEIVSISKAMKGMP